MPPKFAMSAQYKQITKELESEVLDEYESFLNTSSSPDMLLSHIPDMLDNLKIPKCFTVDIDECIQWFYDTGCGNVSKLSSKWVVVEHLLTNLTISSSYNGTLEVSDIIDIDKLVRFCNRLLRFRDHYPIIEEAWKLFVYATGHGGSKITSFRMSMKDLSKVKTHLQLDDISDSILIDMLGCSTTTVDGEMFNYTLLPQGLTVNIKDFAEIMGQLGELD